MDNGHETTPVGGSRFLINGVMQPVSTQQLDKHVPAATNAHATIEERCFLWGPCREVITRADQLRTEFCKGGWEEREAEESPLLEAVAMERLVKTQQAGKGLACVAMIC
jgi:hypothetical protein